MATEILSYKDAKEYTHSLGFKNFIQWAVYTMSSEHPDFLPKNPMEHYTNTGEWEGYQDYLGPDVKIAPSIEPKI